MFGISFSEFAVIAVIALVVVGPQKLPGMLRTIGEWTRKLRKMTTEVRAQTGIDEILREEGIDGVQGLRSLLRGEIAAAKQRGRRGPVDDPYAETLEFDRGREHPVEGPDAYHAIPEDLLDSDEPAQNEAADPSLSEAAVPVVSEASGGVDAPTPSAAPPPFSTTAPEASHSTTGKPS